jgi:RNase P/RNase MRP subunit p30
MFIDVCLPRGNEEKFVLEAKKLGAKGLIFLYEKDSEKNFECLKLATKDFKIYAALLTSGQPVRKRYNYIFSNGGRAHFENKNVDVIFGLETQAKKDSNHYRNSGLNHILAAIAAETGKKLAFSFSSVMHSRNPEQVLGRMMQNVEICRNCKAGMVVASFAARPSELKCSKDLESFGKMIGMTGAESKANFK